MPGVERETPEDDATAIFGRVLVPVNFKMTSHHAIRVALGLQHLCGARVCIFNAGGSDENDRFLAGIGSQTTSGDIASEAKGALQRLVGNIAPGRSDAVEYDATIAEDPVEAIRTKVSEWKATVVVLSHEPHPSLLRTPSEKLVKSLEVPVLVLHPTADTKA